MNESYETTTSPPDASGDDNQLVRRRRFWLLTIWISVAGVIVPLGIGLIGTVFGMKAAFDEMSTSGIGDPPALSGGISMVLLSTAWGLVLSMVAFIVLIGVLIRFFTLPKPPALPPQNSGHNKS